MIAHVQRWIKASVLQHFHDSVEAVKSPASLPFSFYLEGMPYNKNGKMQSGSGGEYYPFPGKQSDGTIYEIALNGPILHHVKGASWKLQSKISVMVTVPIGADLYRIDRECGLLTRCYTQVIEVLRYGDGDEDTGERLSCMKLSDDSRTIAIENLGPIELGALSHQAILVGHYEGDFVLPPL